MEEFEKRFRAFFCRGDLTKQNAPAKSAPVTTPPSTTCFRQPSQDEATRNTICNAIKELCVVYFFLESNLIFVVDTDLDNDVGPESDTMRVMSSAATVIRFLLVNEKIAAAKKNSLHGVIATVLLLVYKLITENDFSRAARAPIVVLRQFLQVEIDEADFDKICSEMHDFEVQLSKSLPLHVLIFENPTTAFEFSAWSLYRKGNVTRDEVFSMLKSHFFHYFAVVTNSDVDILEELALTMTTDEIGEAFCVLGASTAAFVRGDVVRWDHGSATNAAALRILENSVAYLMNFHRESKSIHPFVSDETLLGLISTSCHNTK